MSLTRRDVVRGGVLLAAGSWVGPEPRALAESPSEVERWGLFEASFPGPSAGNPFTEVQFAAVFVQVLVQDGEQAGKATTVAGFYDGDGIYRVRFLPGAIGTWTFRTGSNRPELDGRTGSFRVSPARSGNHGPVRVADKYRFQYADGTPYRELGTTCYAWTSQTPELEERTLKTLAEAPFNKLRMCVFPKWFNYNHTEPPRYAFVGDAPNHWDFTRFDPAFFQHLEQRIAQLQMLGIEADVILFHPYDEGHWGFDSMSAADDRRYVQYVTARLGAYRNVWWSLANEWDYFKKKTEADFERIGQIVAENDPYGHLCSIHQQKRFFDQTRPWITHASVQNDNPENAAMYLRQWNKPVIFDECRYEGDIPEGWGDITAERLVGNFWKTLVSGAYCGHGETYLNAREELWWSKGGVLVGQSPAMLWFFKKAVDAAPAGATLTSARNTWGVEGEYTLTYLWDRQHASQSFHLPEAARYKVEILDTLAMTVTPVPGTFSGKVEISLPVKPYLAIRVVRV